MAEGQQLQVELLGADEGSEVSLRPVLVVDGDVVLATPDQLKGATVTATITGQEKGTKINALTYKAKANQRKRWGHRQKYTTVTIDKISTK